MNIEQLYTFKEVVRLGSFSEVAKKLGISQPAVSFQIQKLEQELGVKLIDRSQRAIITTTAGKRLLRFAEIVDTERESLQRDLEKMREDISGDLQIAASTIPGEFILPPLLAEFKKQHPAVKIQVTVSDSLTVIDRIHDNTYEIGFCGVAPEGKDLVSFKIADDEIVLIVFAGHPFTQKEEVAPEELVGEPIIFREAASGTQQSLEKLLRQAGIDIKKWTPQLTLGSTQAVVSAVAAGAGIAFVSSLAVNRNAQPAAVKPVRVRGLHLNRDFYCVFRRERSASRLYDEFIGFLKSYERSD